MKPKVIMLGEMSKKMKDNYWTVSFMDVNE